MSCEVSRRNSSPEGFRLRKRGDKLFGERLRGTAPRVEKRAGEGPICGGSSPTFTKIQLPELLRYEDRNSMAHSIEARVPMLDHRLVELSFSSRETTSSKMALPVPSSVVRFPICCRRPLLPVLTSSGS